MFNSTPVSLPSACRHSQKCSTCYSGACASECVAEVVFVVQSSQAIWVSSHPPPTRGTVCAHVQCGLRCTSHLYQSLFDRNCMGAGREGGARGRLWPRCVGSFVWGAVWRNCLWELCFIHILYLWLGSFTDSRKCSICYSVACFSECVAELVFVVQSSQACHPTPTRGTVCAHVRCG